MAETIWFQKYRIKKRLGQGGSAEVFLAEHISLSAPRAIKRIPRAGGMHDFCIREAGILKNLSHPLIPVIYDLEQDNSYSYIIMEYLEGVSLKVYRKEHEMKEQEIRKQALQLAGILRYLHGLMPPLLYLDLKPENLMVCKDGNLKLVDFGAAVLKAEGRQMEIRMGTKGYAAPELLQGKKLDERSDIYSFGMLLFFLFTGEAPKRQKKRIENIDNIRGIGKEWREIINRCLKYLPCMRFSSAAVLEERIAAIAGKKGEIRKKQHRICRILRVAGAKGHSGATHISLLLAYAFAAEGKRVLYREMEEQGVVEAVLLRTKGKNCPVRMLRGEEECLSEEWFDVEIRDYGWIGNEEAKALTGEEQVLLVAGASCWEVGELRQVLAEFQNAPLVCLNFTSGREFLKLSEAFREYICIRVPYVPELFGDAFGQGGIFAQRIWEETGLCLEGFREETKNVQ